MTRNRLIGCLCFVMVVGVAAIAVDGGAKSNIKVPSKLSKFIDELRTDLLKIEAKKHAPLLMSKDVAKAKSAVDLFYDLKAETMLVSAMGNKNYQVKAYASDALLGIAQSGNVALTSFVLEQMEGTTTLVTGGSEVQIPRAMYRYSLARLLHKLTGTIQVIVKNAKKERLPAEKVPEISKIVREWLAGKEAQEPKRGKKKDH